MKKHITYLLFSFLLLYSCDSKNSTVEPNNCTVTKLDPLILYNDLILDIPEAVITALVEQPDELGALGRNKSGYFHVRFQLEMLSLSDYTIKFQNLEGLSAYLNNLKYSFSYQNNEGDFQFIPTDELVNSADYEGPSEAELASGTAFFAYSLGLSLHSLSQSDWYNNTSSLSDIRENIQALNPNIERMLTYLKNSEDLLNTVDATAPNRLLFNAIAFYSLGIYLDDQEAKNIGIEFANSALSQIDQTEGYFIEGGGWDSSYNGVAIKLGFELFTLIGVDADQATKDELQQALSCATHWQKSRVISTGEISTEGNTRVYPGGENFLGKEKEVDVKKTIQAFFYMSSLSAENEYEALAQQVIEFYN
ncbi:MAG: hypothetical protein OCD76_22875 [Reichenbachiella sp.]